MSAIEWFAVVWCAVFFAASLGYWRAAKKYHDAAVQYHDAGVKSWEQATARWNEAIEEARKLDERRAQFPGDEWKGGS